MAASLENRVKDLERMVQKLLRDRPVTNARDAKPQQIRKGWWLGILDGSLAQGGTATVSLWTWCITDSAWEDTETNVIARDWYLNTGESIDAGVKVKIEWYHNTWVVTGMWCVVSDT